MDEEEPGRIEFNTENFQLLMRDVGWCRVNCPVCKKYHSQNFLPDLELGKKEYLSNCERCKNPVITDMGTIEQNDKLFLFFNRNESKLRSNGNKSLNNWG